MNKLGKTLHIIIGEAALELIPKEIVNHPVIVKDAMKRGKKSNEILLDISRHYTAMKNITNAHKRGRPDITHLTLLNILGFPINKLGYIQVYVHTISDFVITINPKIRLPRNYNRFIGLIEQLFKEKQIPPKSKNPLMILENINLKDLIIKINPSKTFMLTSAGKRFTPSSLIRILINELNPAIIIGGFQRGEFSEENMKIADLHCAIYPETLDSWIVAAIIVHQYENEMKLYECIWENQFFQRRSSV
ncbi:MAG: 16S rRNA methyltransferase [Candidatus Methanomethylicia archaeon]|nr:16S rRNA methyltransferase [Candidatus Methanomethylicia archaeon]MCX8169304.1 16S rRNA methyltransferase [Candidatus Methanomethylicia archaeon]MDW7988913.1 16S rRNA methyltransferase [Nitrososphaerota archaeon]